MKKILSLVFLTLFLFTSIAYAEIKIYTGVGFFAVIDETLDYAKNKSKIDGERNIAEQIFVDVQSNSEIKNSELIHDKIILMTESLIRVLEVQYKIESAEDDNFIVRAIVTAEVDTDEIEKILTNLKEKNHE